MNTMVQARSLRTATAAVLAVLLLVAVANLATGRSASSAAQRQTSPAVRMTSAHEPLPVRLVSWTDEDSDQTKGDKTTVDKTNNDKTKEAAAPAAVWPYVVASGGIAAAGYAFAWHQLNQPLAEAERGGEVSPRTASLMSRRIQRLTDQIVETEASLVRPVERGGDRELGRLIAQRDGALQALRECAARQPEKEFLLKYLAEATEIVGKLHIAV